MFEKPQNILKELEPFNLKPCLTLYGQGLMQDTGDLVEQKEDQSKQKVINPSCHQPRGRDLTLAKAVIIKGDYTNRDGTLENMNI